MQIKWFGQSSFLLASEAGVRILVDPFDRMIRYKMPKPIETEIVAVTHDHTEKGGARTLSSVLPWMV